jgi:hypothetical protein
MSAIWESANWTLQTGNRQFGMLPARYSQTFIFSLFLYISDNMQLVTGYKTKRSGIELLSS